MMLVAWPRILGPTTCMLTATTASSTTPQTCTRSWRRRENVRRTAWPKSRDCSPGTPIGRGPAMRRRGPDGRLVVAASSSVVVRVAHAAASCCLVWDATISA